jgi:hypothetical protein
VVVLLAIVAYGAAVSFPLRAALLAAPPAQNPAARHRIDVSGKVLRAGDSGGVAGVTLQLRNLDTGEIDGRTVSDENGAYSFEIPKPGRYLVEAVDDGGVRAVTNPLTFGGSGLSANVILPAAEKAAGFWAGSTIVVLSVASAAGIGAIIAGRTPTTPISPER